MLGLEQFGMGDQPGSPSCMRTSGDKVCRKDLCWAVMAVYVLYKLPDISGPGLAEAGCYMARLLFRRPSVLPVADSRFILVARRSSSSPAPVYSARHQPSAPPASSPHLPLRPQERSHDKSASRPSSLWWPALAADHTGDWDWIFFPCLLLWFIWWCICYLASYIIHHGSQFYCC